MASSLTIAQKIALFEVLEVPYNEGYYSMNGMGTLSSDSDVSGTASNAKTEIETYLDTLDSDSGETELTAYINRWIAIGTKTPKIEGGSVGDVNGITFDYDHERSVIERRIRTIVPFYKHHEVTRLNRGNDSINIQVIR